MLEANPRASRTVPFASKATGVNLVEAACRLAAGETLADLELAAPDLSQVSVKAAVLPFARFPGADPVLGPGDALDRRGDGERRRLPDRVRQGRARRRAAAADRPGTAFLSVRDADKPAAVPVAAALSGLGFRLLATAGTARALARRRARGRARAQGDRGGRRGATVVDLVRRGRCDLVVNTPQGSGARTDGYLIREAALVARVPCITTISARAPRSRRSRTRAARSAVSLQERIDAETRTA